MVDQMPRRLDRGGGGGSVVEFRADPASTPSTSSEQRWANYVRGVVMQYIPDLPGDETFVLDVAIAGDVPLGSGLSSSASLEVATAVFLECVMERRGIAYSSYDGGRGSDPNGAAMSAMEVAKERAIRCQRAENVFCGVPCGERILRCFCDETTQIYLFFLDPTLIRANIRDHGSVSEQRREPWKFVVDRLSKLGFSKGVSRMRGWSGHARSGGGKFKCEA